jgi:hypothetical protein
MGRSARAWRAGSPRRRWVQRYVNCSPLGMPRRHGGFARKTRRSRKTRAGRTRGYTLEDSARKPSRKSTRKSANRAKSGSKLARRQRQRIRTPKARAARAQAQQR